MSETADMLLQGVVKLFQDCLLEVWVFQQVGDGELLGHELGLPLQTDCPLQGWPTPHFPGMLETWTHHQHDMGHACIDCDWYLLAVSSTC